jgi:hypothetical protein
VDALKVFGRPPEYGSGNRVRHLYTPPRVFGVYFIQAGVDGLIKIGRSANLGTRFDYLQEEQRNLPQHKKVNPQDDELYIRRIIALDRNRGSGVSVRAERLLHRALRFCRAKGQGREWFKPYENLQWFIDDPFQWPLLLDWLQK